MLVLWAGYVSNSADILTIDLFNYLMFEDVESAIKLGITTSFFVFLFIKSCSPDLQLSCFHCKQLSHVVCLGCYDAVGGQQAPTHLLQR